MRTSQGLTLAKELLTANMTVDMLALEIYDLLNLHQEGTQLGSKEKFILGLRYSEFYTDGNDDKDYWAASEKRIEYLKYLGISEEELRNKVDKLFGIDVDRYNS